MPVRLQADGQLVLFNKTYADAKNARCLDGSPAGFYSDLASTAVSKKWIIYLEGGGICNTKSDCTSRSHTALGSSTKWGSSKSFSSILSSDASENPDFNTWAHIFVPYCSGDVYAGTITEPTNETFGLYFSGHLIVAAVIDYLIAAGSLDSATDVILTGSSAGGLGTYNNIDYVASRLSGVRVVGVPQGGWYFPYVATYSRWEQGLPPDFDGKPYYDLYHSYLNENCVSAHKTNPWNCTTVLIIYPYIKTPLYVAENMYDSDKILARLHCPHEVNDKTIEFAMYYGLEARRSMEMVGNSTKHDGIYMPACFDHTGDLSKFTTSPKINGTTFAESLGDWYFGRGKFPTQLVDTCRTINCTPGCKKLEKTPFSS
jgi:ribosome maturation protein SDO1